MAMGSIWDVPQNAGAETDTTTKASTGGKSVATTGTVERIYGTQAGALLTPAGRGVIGGVPYGESALQRAEALNAQYPFQPQAVARLRAATRRALGSLAVGGMGAPSGGGGGGLLRTAAVGQSLTVDDLTFFDRVSGWLIPVEDDPADPAHTNMGAFVLLTGLVEGATYDLSSPVPTPYIGGMSLVTSNDFSATPAPVGSYVEGSAQDPSSVFNEVTYLDQVAGFGDFGVTTELQGFGVMLSGTYEQVLARLPLTVVAS